VESLETGNEIETSFQLEGAPASVSCFGNYPSIIKVGELMDALKPFGVKMNVLQLAEPDDL
jgi:hypothetical protein